MEPIEFVKTEATLTDDDKRRIKQQTKMPSAGNVQIDEEAVIKEELPFVIDKFVTVGRSGSDMTKGNHKNQEETLKECQKLLDSKVNTEDFICALEQQPAIWDTSSEAYSNKQLKLNAWNEVCCTFLPDFEQRSLAERNILVTLIQKKWKSIRSCYTRELLRLKGVKSGSAATRKKQYTYFEQLRFLETAVKKPATNVEEEDIVNDEEENEASILFDNGPAGRISQNKSKKRTSNNHELIEVLKKRIASEEKCRTWDEADEDKLFLLSMLSEIHKVPAENKLKLRADMISLVAAAQTPVPQGWQQMGYTGPSKPMPPPSMLHTQQHPMQQPGLMTQQPQIQFFQTQFQQRQDANTPLQSPPSVDTSILSNEDSESEMSDPLLFSI